jgi:hypothetical protein
MIRRQANKALIEEAMPFYREGGEAIGELLSTYPEQEPEIWALVAGLGLWKRQYLVAFKSIWRRENPTAYSRIKTARHRRRRSKANLASRLEEAREASKPLAMPTETRPPRRKRERE